MTTNIIQFGNFILPNINIASIISVIHAESP
jgi:hypothetical protein